MATFTANGKLMLSRASDKIQTLGHGTRVDPKDHSKAQTSSLSESDRLFHSQVASIFSLDGPFLRLIHNLESFYGLKVEIFTNYPSKIEALKLKKSAHKLFSRILCDFIITFAITFENIIHEKVYDLERAILILNTLRNSFDETDQKVIGKEVLQIQRLLTGETEEDHFSQFLTRLEETEFDCFFPFTNQDLEEIRAADLNFFKSTQK